MIEKLFTYIYIALAIYFTVAFIYGCDDRTLFIALWCGTMLEIRAIRMPNIFIELEQKKKPKEETKDDT